MLALDIVLSSKYWISAVENPILVDHEVLNNQLFAVFYVHSATSLLSHWLFLRMPQQETKTWQTQLN